MDQLPDPWWEQVQKIVDPPHIVTVRLPMRNLLYDIRYFKSLDGDYVAGSAWRTNGLGEVSHGAHHLDFTVQVDMLALRLKLLEIAYPNRDT